MRDDALPELLARRWRDALEPGERFLAFRGIEGDLAVARFTLVAADGRTHFQFEVAAEAGEDTGRILDLVTDACDLSIGAWLEDGRPRLSGVPEERSFEGVPVRLTCTVRRPGLEAEADRLLGEDDRH